MRTPSSTAAFDVIALGEPLIEFSSAGPITAGASCRLDVSGDVVNSAAAAAAAGARVAVVARVADDELGQAVIDRFVELGVNTDHIRRDPRPQGIYVQHSDPHGERQFCYARTGSAGSALSVADLPAGLVEEARAVVASGITGAISASARGALLAAARRSAQFIYDPNHRPRLTTADDARTLLLDLAPHAALLTPSAPGEINNLLAIDTPETAARLLREHGATAVAVTCGADGVHLAADTVTWQPAIPAPAVVDQTGAGDVFAGTVAARLALGDALTEAVRLGAAASSLAVGGVGGSGGIRPLADVRAHADRLVEVTE